MAFTYKPSRQFSLPGPPGGSSLLPSEAGTQAGTGNLIVLDVWNQTSLAQITSVCLIRFSM